MMAYLGALAWLFAVVSFGAIIPIVPTGAAVSGAAALAFHEHHPITIVLVILVGAAGAYCGDLVMYGMCRIGGEQLARRLRWLRDEEHLASVKARLQKSQVPVLLVSRLIPGGRVPVLLAAGLAGYKWERFAIVDLAASSLWAAVYMAIGLLGYALFDEPWQGVLAAIVLVILTTVVSGVVQRARRKKRSHAE